MNEIFTSLAQANMDHYNNHPTKHAVLTAAAGVVAVVVIHKIGKRAGESMLAQKMNSVSRIK